MDIAVFSDIHSNYIALQECFEHCISRGITRFILLGDYGADCPYPQKTIEFMKMLKQHFDCIFLKGNKDQALIDYHKRGGEGLKNGSASGAFLYTYESLTDRDFNFLDRMAVYTEFKEFPPRFEICHGSPASPSELIVREKRNTRKILSSLKTNLLIHGHNHIADSFEYREKRCANPGSLGLPAGHGGKAQFMILHGDGKEWTIEQVQKEYDRQALYTAFDESGLMERAPAWCALTMHTLRTGIDLSEIVKLRAMQICREERGTADWPNIPEVFWAYALRENSIDLYGKDIPKPSKK